MKRTWALKIVIAQNKEESKDKDKDQKPKSAATFITETKGEKSPRTWKNT